jgi:hypothetical protein
VGALEFPRLSKYRVYRDENSSFDFGTDDIAASDDQRPVKRPIVVA